MSDALVSVVMPAFEEQDFIAEALDSLLAQTYGAVEVIVVDDGTGDRTAEIAHVRGVRVLRRSHRGAAAACNAGLALARGEYWAIFDADDVMPPDRLARQVAYLAQHPELGIVLGLTEAFITPGEPRPPHYNAAWDDGPFPACTGTMLARLCTFDAVGQFDETRAICYDLDWLARAKDAGVRAGNVDHVALRYRIHRGNSTSDSAAVNVAMLKVLRDSLQRRRATVASR
jgi:glycosyltransferase involved in cell wall biosynthesis